MKKTYIESLVHYHPEGIITNKKFEETLDTTSDWIFDKVGIRERRFMSDYTDMMPVHEISRRAFLKLLKKLGGEIGKIDFIISASTHDDLHYPNPANLISEEFKICAPAMQIKTACTSVAYAIATAKAYISNGFAKRILILNGEPFTRFVDYGDRSSCILFGDAATAMIVSDVESGLLIEDIELGGEGLKIVDSSRVSDTSHFTPSEFASGHLSPGNAIVNRRRNSDRKFQQDGKQVVQFVMEKLPGSLLNFMTRNKVNADEIGYFICHQSNFSMMSKLFESLKLEKARHLHNIEMFGNVSSAGWVSVLSENLDYVQRGDRVLVSSFGAGMTWANIILKKIS